MGKNKAILWTQTAVLGLIALIIMAVIFLISLSVPKGIGFGAMYIVVVLYSWVLPIRHAPLYTGFVSSILVIIAFILHEESIEGRSLMNLNIVISLVVIWISTSLVQIANKGYRKLEQSNLLLEEKVKERTESLNKSIDQLKELHTAINEIDELSVLLLTVNGDIKNWNKGLEKLSGYAQEDIVGLNFNAFFLREDINKDIPVLMIRNAEKFHSVSIEGWSLRKDGSKFWASTSLTSIPNIEGEVIGFVLVTKDLSDIVNANKKIEKNLEELHLKNKELEEFAYIASHDLQEPLRTISNFSTILSTSYDDVIDDTGKKSINYIIEATGRMKTLIQELLSYSNVGQEVKEKTKVDLNFVVISIQEDLELKISETGARIKSGKLPEIKGHMTELRLLFQNLISNSLKFIRKGTIPTINISCKQVDDNWLFEVSDNGIGIKEEHHAKIFAIFQRLHSRSQYEGTGIGLAHCYKVVQNHGGKIWVESKYGQGTSFFFTIPVA